MAELVSRDNYNSGAIKFQEWIKKTNINLCIQNRVIDLEASDVGDNEGLVFNLKMALMPNSRVVISNPEDLARLKENFNQIKSCLQERSDNHPVVSKLIDVCEVFADNGQLTDYKDCLIGKVGSVWLLDWSGQDL